MQSHLATLTKWIVAFLIIFLLLILLLCSFFLYKKKDNNRPSYPQHHYGYGY